METFAAVWNYSNVHGESSQNRFQFDFFGQEGIEVLDSKREDTAIFGGYISR